MSADKPAADDKVTIVANHPDALKGTPPGVKPRWPRQRRHAQEGGQPAILVEADLLAFAHARFHRLELTFHRGCTLVDDSMGQTK
jgi:hypothetical protein